MAKYNLIEIKRFIRKYLVKILITSTIIGLLATMVGLFFIKDSPNNTGDISDSENAQNSEHTDEETSSNFPVNSDPAVFQFYVERQDGAVFNNRATIQSFLNTEEVYEAVLGATGVNLANVRDKAVLDGKEDFIPVSININEASNIFTAVIEVGRSTSSLRVASFYYEYLFGGESEFFENNLIYSVLQPKLLELQEETGENEDIILDKEPGIESDRKSYVDLIIIFIIGTIVGGVITVSLFVFKEITSKKLSFSFGYLFDNSDKFFLYDENLRNKEFIGHFIGFPRSKEKLVLSEYELTEKEFELLFAEIESEIDFTGEKNTDMNIDIKKSLNETSLKKDYTEIIIVVKSGDTSREWFESQLRLATTYGISLKIIQIN